MNPRSHSTTLAAGLLAAGALLLGCSAGDPSRAAAPPSPLSSFEIATGMPAPEFDRTETGAAPAPAAASPVDAVRRYLDAEVERDAAGAYGVLAESSRRAAGSETDWAAAFADGPRLVGYEQPAVVESSGAATVTTTVMLEPRLDEVAGLVPAQATVEFAVVAEDRGWRLDIERSSSMPQLPADSGAARAAERWATARQACRRAGEYDGSLLGSPALADELCGTAGQFRASAPERLDDLSGPVVAAFGPDSVEWARVVRLQGPASLSVVTAPFGDQWVVVAVHP